MFNEYMTFHAIEYDINVYECQFSCAEITEVNELKDQRK